jgi:hypothetical protein
LATLYSLNTAPTAITVNTTGQQWNPQTGYLATNTWVGGFLGTAVPGGVLRTSEEQSGSTWAAIYDNLYGNANQGDCTSFNDDAGTIADYGTPGVYNQGPCVISDANGHPRLQGNGTAPTITAHTGTTAGTLVSGSSDNKGIITGNTAITAITLTFATAMPTAPVCTANTSVSGTTVYVPSAPTTAAVTFDLSSALTGVIYYHCL